MTPVLTCLGKTPFKNIVGKGGHAGNEHFPTMLSTLSKTEIIIYVTFILSSAIAFNLDKVKFLSSWIGLIELHEGKVQWPPQYN